MTRMIEFYNEQVEDYKVLKGTKPSIDNFINTDSKKIKWTDDIKNDASKGKNHYFQQSSLRISLYRPFCKQWIYYNKDFNWSRYLTHKIYPLDSVNNLVIVVTSIGAKKDFSA
ncbi:MAG: type ISP restriction/modification enzyme, partial [Dolichospermum sp.]